MKNTNRAEFSTIPVIAYELIELRKAIIDGERQLLATLKNEEYKLGIQSATRLSLTSVDVFLGAHIKVAQERVEAEDIAKAEAAKELSLKNQLQEAIA